MYNTVIHNGGEQAAETRAARIGTCHNYIHSFLASNAIRGTERPKIIIVNSEIFIPKRSRSV